MIAQLHIVKYYQGISISYLNAYQYVSVQTHRDTHGAYTL